MLRFNALYSAVNIQWLSSHFSRVILALAVVLPSVALLDRELRAEDPLLAFISGGIHDGWEARASYSQQVDYLKRIVAVSSGSYATARKEGASAGIPIEAIMVQANYSNSQSGYRRFQKDVQSGEFFRHNTQWRSHVRVRTISNNAVKIVRELARRRGLSYYAVLDPHDPTEFTIHVRFVPSTRRAPSVELKSWQRTRGVTFAEKWPKKIGPEGFTMLCRRKSKYQSAKVVLNFDHYTPSSVNIKPYRSPPPPASPVGSLWLESTRGAPNEASGMAHTGFGFAWQLSGRGPAWPAWWTGSVWYYPNLKWKSWSEVSKVEIQLDGTTVRTLRSEGDFNEAKKTGINALKNSISGYGDFGSKHGLSQSWVANVRRDYIKHNGRAIHEQIINGTQPLRVKATYKNGQTEILKVK